MSGSFNALLEEYQNRTAQEATTTPSASTYVQNNQDISDRYGFTQQQITVDPKKPTDAAAQATLNNMDFYKQFYTPLLEENLGRIQGTEAVDEARENANAGFQGLSASNQRNRRRYNMGGGQPAAVRRAMDSKQGLAQSLNYDNTVNQARVDAADRTTAARNDYLNVFNGINSSSSAGLASASAGQRARDAANEQRDAAASAQKMQTIGTVAMMAAMFL